MKNFNNNNVLQFKKLESCSTCNGYYGPCFGEPVCATCHAFLYADDLDSEVNLQNLSVEGGEDRDSGNEEPPGEDFPLQNNQTDGGEDIHRAPPVIRLETLSERLAVLSSPSPRGSWSSRRLFDDLPPEVLVVIFSHLDDISLYAVGNVCKRWRSILLSSVVTPRQWHIFTQRRWPLFLPLANVQDWFSVYSALVESSYCLTCIYQMAEVIPADINSLPLREKRLGHDLRNFVQDPLEGIRAQPLDSSYYHWQASITGPVGSPYEGGIFFLYLKVPFTYPFDPPKVRFLSRIFHPNISRHGDVGIDLIQENNWSSSLTIPKVLISIQSLLTDPYCDICMEPKIGLLYRTDRRRFDDIARLWTWKYAIHDAIPPKKDRSVTL